jgi:hypothetical protein
LGYEDYLGLGATRQNANTRGHSELFYRLFDVPDGTCRWEIQRLSSDQIAPPTSKEHLVVARDWTPETRELDGGHVTDPPGRFGEVVVS